MLLDAAPIALASIVGLAVGSFMTVVAERVPAKASIMRPASYCPSCHTPIARRDNVPVIGWVLLRGRCRSCGERISARYPLLELSTAVVIAGAFIAYDDVWVAVGVAALVGLMPCIAVIDIQHRIIPNRITYPALVAFAVYLLVAAGFDAPVDIRSAAIGLAAYGGTLFIVALVSGGMGMGDVKLAGIIGLMLGAIGLDLVAVAGSAAIVIGAVAAVIALAKGVGRKGALPFGPALAGGAVIGAFWGQAIADWYQRSVLHV
jgi:leader peptidase (prepilin peptidase) / N-methyltransferase